MTRRKKTGSRSGKNRRAQHRDIDIKVLEAIVEKTKASLSEEEHETLRASVDTLVFFTQELERKGTSIERLRRLIFGATTEKTSQVLGEESPPGAAGDAGGQASDAGAKGPRKGHGRNGAAAYTGAQKVTVPHDSLKRGDTCPKCEKGKVYPEKDPGVLVRVRGMAPMLAVVYEMERLRCNLCGEVITARPPEGVGEVKYDESVPAMIAQMKYGSGLPFNRIEKLQNAVGIPLPASTQWDLVSEAYEKIEPAHAEMIHQAAQGDVVHNDDTTMRILKLERDEADTRTGVFTSGIVSTKEEREIVLFFTGEKHAGENLADVLAHRVSGLSPPIQMCDALSRNTSGDFETILANCMTHARRRYVDVVDNFPDECKYVIETLRALYVNDACTKGMTPEERLDYHKEHSTEIMEGLDQWCHKQFDEHIVEPNSGLGDAIGYMIGHWTELTLFLRVPGAPLDNNICERSLKKVILHRKNSYFFKTENGARVGDGFMSLIFTAERCHANPFDYLVELQRHSEQVAENPADWMPWNYRETLASITTEPSQ